MSPKLNLSRRKSSLKLTLDIYNVIHHKIGQGGAFYQMEQHTLYILLSDTGTILSRVIKTYTRMPLNHASIAFDPGMQEVYSFGRKNPRNPLSGGFVQENVFGDPFITKSRATECALYRCHVSSLVYVQLRQQMAQMLRMKQAYKYNFVGLFAVALRLELQRENAYFCSQFVSSIFEQSGFPLVAKPACLCLPSDFEKSQQLQLVYRGNLREYLNGNALAESIAFEMKPLDKSLVTSS